MKHYRRLSLLIIFGLVAGMSLFGTAALVQAARPAAPAQPPTTIVELNTAAASPNTVTVKVGQAVQFNSRDGRSHELALGEGGAEHDHTGAYNSGEFGADEAWRVVFSQPGSFFFHDHLHPELNILVVAYESQK